MADLQFTMTLDGRSGNKNAVVQSALILIPGAGEITMMIADTVDLSRRVEIMEGLRWLYRGLVERDLFTEFAFSHIITSCPLDDLSIPARKTQSDVSIVAPGDIAIGIDASLTDPSKGHGSIETAHQQLRAAASEDTSW